MTVIAVRRTCCHSGSVSCSDAPLDWMNELVLMGLEEQFRRSPQVQQNEPKLKQEVLAGSVSPFAAARTLLGILGRKE